VNLNFVIDRVKKILLQPKEEWKEIEREAYSVQEIYTRYAMIVAAVPALAGFIGWTFVGVPIGLGVAHLIIEYLLSLASVYVLGLLINALAPKFDGEKDAMQALKVAVFASTAGWVAGIFNLVPPLAILALAGLYSLYLLYLGMPLLMKVPEDKALPYTAVVIVVALAIWVLIAGAVALTIPGKLRGF
jgi:hypothetical protein